MVTMRGLCGFLLLLLVPATAAAGPLLDEARRARAALQGSRALELTERALARGDNGPDEVAELHAMAGELLAGLGQEAQASERYRRWLALRPGASFASDASPKVVAPLEAARRWLAGRTLRVRARSAPGGAAVLEVEDDPAGMVTGARLRCRTMDGRELVSVTRGARLELRSPEPCAQAVLSALDDHGNELVRVALQASSPPVPPAAATSPHEISTPTWYRRTGVWAAASAGFGAAGLTLGLLARQAQDDLDGRNRTSAGRDFSEADSVASRGRWTAALANASFALAGLGALAATATLVWPERPRALVVVPTGTGIGLAGTF